MTTRPANNRTLKWMVAALLALIVFCVGVSFTASQRASAVDARQAACESYLRETLTEIRDDIREIRATQTQMLRNGDRE